MAPRVICLGRAVLDHLFRVGEIPAPPAKERASAYAAMVGGMAANAAIAVARLGGQAALWGRLGEDANGAAARAELEAQGVDCTHLRAFPGARTPVSAVVVDKRGERVTFGWRGEDELVLLDTDEIRQFMDQAGAALFGNERVRRYIQSRTDGGDYPLANAVLQFGSGDPSAKPVGDQRGESGQNATD